MLSDIATQEAVNALLRCRETGDVRLWYRVLKGMNRIRAAGARVSFPRGRVTLDLELDVKSHLFAHVHYRACPIGGKGSAERLFCVALNERVDQALNRVFRRLALLYPAEEILAAYRGITSDDRRARGSALLVRRAGAGNRQLGDGRDRRGIVTCMRPSRSSRKPRS